MSDLNSNPPTVGSDPETNNDTALHEQHREGNKTASIASQTNKRQRALQLPTEGQQTTWPENTGLQLKKPRLQSTDREATIDPQIPSPKSIMSAHPQQQGFHAQSQVSESSNATAHPSVQGNQSLTIWAYKPTSQLQSFYQPFTLSPLAPQPENNFNTLPFPSHPMYSCGSASQQMQHVWSADQGAQRHVPHPHILAPESDLHSSSRSQTAYPLLENKVAGRPIPLAKLAKDQPPQFPHSTETPSPAQSLQRIWRTYWAQVMIVLGQHVPPSMHPRVLDELSSHRYQWASDKIYRKVLGIDKNRAGFADLKKLGEWMYGTEDSTLATWRETLSTKDGAAKKVPWVKRERLIALYVVFAGFVQDRKSRMAKLRPRFDMVEKCKLTYLISHQDHVVPNTYWEGFAEELEKDPDQEHLYDKVVQAKHSTTPASMNNWPSFPIPEQEPENRGSRATAGKRGLRQVGFPTLK